MKRERSRRMVNILSKVVGSSFAALLLSSMGATQAQADTLCVVCRDPPIGPEFCTTMAWFESGGGTSCYFNQSGCQVYIPPGWSCS